MPRRSARLSDKMEKCKQKGETYTYDPLLEESDKKTKGCRKKCTPKQKRSKNGRCYARKKSPARKTTKKKTTARKNTKRKTTARKNTKRKNTKRKNTKKKTSPKTSPAALKLATENTNAINKLVKLIEKANKSPKKRTARKTKVTTTARKTKTSRKRNTGKKSGKCPKGTKPIPGLKGECMLA